jgi:hypothetical protein
MGHLHPGLRQSLFRSLTRLIMSDDMMNDEDKTTYKPLDLITFLFHHSSFYIHH